MSRPFLPAALLLLAACGAGWHRVEPDPTTTLPSREQVLVYHPGAVERWHAARVSGDSLSGVPWLRPVDCDSCRRSLPLSSIDSMRVGNPTRGFMKSAGVGYLGLIGLAFILCRFEECSLGD